MRASFHLFFRSLLALMTSCCALATLGQSAQISEEQLTVVLPQAERFSTKQGEPPVYIGYASSAEDAEIVGYAFETTDFEPQEIGYSAPIEVLVGIDLEGELAGIEILFYRESYKSIRGDFLNSERFPNQFAGKSVADGFRVGRDIDGVSRATISSWAVSRGIRNSAREVASAYLGEAAIFANASVEDQALSLLAPLSWEGLIDDGLVKPWPVSLEDGSQIELTVAFMGNEKLGEMLVGSEDYSRAEREASNRVSAGTLLLIGIAGNASSPFRQENLALQQNEWTYQVERRRFVYVGSAEEGKSRNKMRFAGAIVLPPEVDIAQPFTLFYNTGIEVDSIDQLEQVVYQVPPIALALAQGRQVPAEFLPDTKDEYADLPVETSLQALLNSAPWSETALLVLLLCVATTAFVLKNARLRWAALLFTFVYLGFVNGTFL